MKHTWKIISTMIALSITSNVMADCLDSTIGQRNGPLMFSDLVKYDKCMKTEMTKTSSLKLSQSTWAAACVNTPGGHVFVNNECFGDNPNSNANTLLLLQVTNIAALANLRITGLTAGTYPDNSIWIGQFPAGTYTSNITGTIPYPTTGAQAFCAPFTEVGWGIPTVGINTDFANPATINRQANSPLGGTATISNQYVQAINVTNGSGTLTMTTTGVAAVTKIPLYIICVGRDTNSNPVSLGETFAVNWPAAG